MKSHHHHVWSIVVLAGLWLCPRPAGAQTNEGQSFLRKNFQLTGQAGVSGELYDAYGITRRRSPSSGRLSFTPTLAFSKYVSASADLLLSTEGSYARQNINILGLHPAWKWGKAHLGDYSDNFSAFTFSGVNVTGAEVDLFPGKLRFTAGGGRTRRAVEGDITSRTFAQYLFASRVGYGDPQGTFLHLIVLKAKDDPASLALPDTQRYTAVILDTMQTELDTLWQTPPYNPYAVTPQENLVAGLTGRIELFEKKLALGLELAGAAFTKDLHAARADADSLDVLGLAEKVYAFRTSSQFDYALSTDASAQVRGVRGNLVYKQAGPGFVSLGLPATANDRREVQGNTSFKLGNSYCSLGHSFMTDNLADQKMETNRRNQSQASVSTARGRWRAGLNANLLLMGNQAQNDSLAWHYWNLVLATTQSLALGQDRAWRQVGLQYTFQTSTKDMYANTEESQYHTVNLTSGFRLREKLNLNVAGGLSFRRSQAQGFYVTQVYSARLAHTALANRLTSSLASSSSMVRDTRMYRTVLAAAYRLTQKDGLTFDFSHNFFQGTQTYNELRASLGLSHSL